MDIITPLSAWWALLGLVVIWAARSGLVDRPAIMRWGSTGLRLAAIILLVLALTQPQLLKETDRRHRVYILDTSHSIDVGAAQRAVDTVSRDIDNLTGADSWSLFAMASDLRVYEPGALRQDLDAWAAATRTDHDFRSQTRLAQALRSARLDMPADRQREIVLLSDGQGTDTGLRETIADLRAEHIRLRFEPIAGINHDEVAIAGLSASNDTTYHGEVLRLQAHLVANSANRVRVKIIRDGVVLTERTVDVAAETTTDVGFDLTMDTPGELRWRCEIVPERDHFQINNQAECSIRVRGKPRLLILHQQADEIRGFARSLRKQGFEVDVRGRFGLPEELEGMLAFDCIVFANLPATLLSTAQMQHMKRYVTDFGGGIVMMGSQESFGLGGYYQTPIEDVLPLTSRYEKEKEKPSLAMMLVIDKSGSMQGMPIALARQAAKATVDVLSPRDAIGVIAFDGQAYLVSELQSASNADAIKSAIGSVGANGGTNMYPGMEVAFQQLEQASAKIKHVIILGDGQSSPGDFLGLTQRMAQAGITVSTVALGGGADQQLLAAIAETGGGRGYVTMDPSTVPQIFTKETLEASNSAIKEDLFGSLQTGDHPLLANYQADELPFLLGYVMTQAKPTAQVLLSVDTGDPLLAIGRYGLGMGMAFTADMSERWGAEWLAWGDCGRFWAQALRPVLRKVEASGVHVRQSFADDHWQLDISRSDHDGNPIGGVAWQATANGNRSGSTSLRVDEVGIGRYRTRMPLGDDSRLSINLVDGDGGKQVTLHHQQAYPPEYRLDRQATELLNTLADVDQSHIQTRRPIAHWLLLTAMLCAMLGILLRRI